MLIGNAVQLEGKEMEVVNGIDDASGCLVFKRTNRWIVTSPENIINQVHFNHMCQYDPAVFPALSYSNIPNHAGLGYCTLHSTFTTHSQNNDLYLWNTYLNSPRS